MSDALATQATLSERFKPLRMISLATVGSFVIFGVVVSLLGLPVIWSTDAALRYLGTLVVGGAVYLAATPLSRRQAPEYPARVHPLTFLRLVGATLPNHLGLALCFTFPDDGMLFFIVGAVTSIVAVLVGVFPRVAILPDYPAGQDSAVNVIEHISDNPVIERG